MCTQNFLRPQALFFSFLRRAFNRKICKDGLIWDRWLTSFERKTMFWPMFIIWGLLWVNVQQSEATLFIGKGLHEWRIERVNNFAYFSKKKKKRPQLRGPGTLRDVWKKQYCHLLVESCHRPLCQLRGLSSTRNLCLCRNRSNLIWNFENFKWSLDNVSDNFVKVH